MAPPEPKRHLNPFLLSTEKVFLLPGRKLHEPVKGKIMWSINKSKESLLNFSEPRDTVLANWRKVMIFLLANTLMCVTCAILLNINDRRQVRGSILNHFFRILTGVRSGAEIGLPSLWFSVSQGVSLGDFLLEPTNPIGMAVSANGQTNQMHGITRSQLWKGLGIALVSWRYIVHLWSVNEGFRLTDPQPPRTIYSVL